MRSLPLLLLAAGLALPQYIPMTRPNRGTGSPMDATIAIDGTLKAIDHKMILVETEGENSVTFERNKKTRLLDAKGKPLKSDPAPGANVAVDCRKERNGTLIAVQLRVL